MLKTVLVLTLVAAVSLPAAADAAESAPRKNTVNGVTVAVTPDFGAKAWTFKVSLDTHTQELSDDLARSAVLTDDQGKRYTPIAWEGTGPGGHHRQGVLRFAVMSPTPEFVQLAITRNNEAAPRLFRWQLK